MKEKEFTNARNWVAENSDTDSNTIFRAIYDQMKDVIKPESIPRLVLIIAEYQYKNEFVADKEINLVAFFVEVMANVEFK